MRALSIRQPYAELISPRRVRFGGSAYGTIAYGDLPERKWRTGWKPVPPAL